ncbi:aldose 1-epimerase family protein [Streptoalloteichus hindustanus]|uniref:Aldose 1-epimerase n=1 Tax=Streptoalloteichus hindustanus TaxID=2017 RepID=A0A1M5PHS4_STRHI|nr:aldose 1-epimerase family protein [Streptoalloteichus hindustanus]SHH01346.1 aldose 1-epimerase [Streptoalloteichus hindustanus]
MLVSGEQFEIRRGNARAVVTEVGATLRVFEVGGTPYLETFDADGPPPSGAGAVLMPWPNRVADGRWTFDGEPQQLALSEPARHNAIHGLTRHASWLLADRAEDAVHLTTRVNVQPGWPVPLRVSVRYALTDQGLEVTHSVTNLGRRAVPFGIGAHPYPRAGHAETDDCVLVLSADTVLPVDVRLLPSGPARPVGGTEQDFRAPGQPLRRLRLDTAFGGCAPEPDDPEQLVRHALHVPDGTGVELWAEPVFRWVQVYVANHFPGRGRAIAIEPMTCPPDALNSGVDLLRVEPDETVAARWGLRPLP